MRLELYLTEHLATQSRMRVWHAAKVEKRRQKVARLMVEKLTGDLQREVSDAAKDAEMWQKLRDIYQQRQQQVAPMYPSYSTYGQFGQLNQRFAPGTKIPYDPSQQPSYYMTGGTSTNIGTTAAIAFGQAVEQMARERKMGTAQARSLKAELEIEAVRQKLKTDLMTSPIVLPDCESGPSRPFGSFQSAIEQACAGQYKGKSIGYENIIEKEKDLDK